MKRQLDALRRAVGVLETLDKMTPELATQHRSAASRPCSDEATAAERAQLVTVCKDCHAKGSSPMLPGFFRPDALRPR